MKKKLTILFMCLLTISLSFALFSCSKKEEPYYGKYKGGTNNSTIAIDSKYVTYQGAKNKYSIDGNTIISSDIGEMTFYEDYNVLSSNVFVPPNTTQYLSQRDGFFRANFSEFNYMKISSTFLFYENGSFNFISPSRTDLTCSGKYYLKNGIMKTIYSFNISPFKSYISYHYIRDGGLDAFVWVKNPDDYFTDIINPPAPSSENTNLHINYTASEGGKINGITQQSVKPGEDGTTVTATPHEGYIFSGWSDGITSATRQELNVTKNISVTAKFEKKIFTLEYLSEYGGHVEGETTQVVKYGENGTTVEAIAEEGFEFIGWSDGTPSTTRTARNVTENMIITAKFRELEKEFDGGNGSIESPYRISTVTHLKNIDKYPNAYYILLNDIVFPTDTNETTPNFFTLCQRSEFNGNLNGNGKCIFNLRIIGNEYNVGTGLFETIGEKGRIHDLSLKNISYIGMNNTGGIAAQSKGIVSDCFVSGIIQTQNTYGNPCIGGIIGYFYPQSTTTISLKNLQSEIMIVGNHYAGGIIGLAEARCKANFTNFHSSGTINSCSVGGGIIGRCIIKSKFENCSFSGNISATGSAGGLVGSTSAAIEFEVCYFSGEINALDTNSYLGGFIGTIYSSGETSISDCFAKGSIHGENRLGGLIGCTYSFASIQNCYFVGEIKGSTSVGGLIGHKDSFDQISFTNAHWLSFGNENIKNALGFNYQSGLPYDDGAIMHTDIADFYTLAETLNANRNKPIWKNSTTNSLPSLVNNE